MSGSVKRGLSVSVVGRRLLSGNDSTVNMLHHCCPERSTSSCFSASALLCLPPRPSPSFCTLTKKLRRLS